MTISTHVNLVNKVEIVCFEWVSRFRDLNIFFCEKKIFLWLREARECVIGNGTDAYGCLQTNKQDHTFKSLQVRETPTQTLCDLFNEL